MKQYRYCSGQFNFVLPDKEFRLNSYLAFQPSGQRELFVIPAYRYAVGTISSSNVLDVWRMVSEDSNQFFSGFLAIHCLSYLNNLNQPVAGQMMIVCH
jgi:hypothetical protein